MERHRASASDQGRSSSHSTVQRHHRDPDHAGAPLDSDVRAVMQSRFGHDFGNVRIHHDADADRQAGDVHARAFARGDDLFFRNGAFAPDSLDGMRLLAHELTHVVQRDRGATEGPALSDPSDASEREARAAAESVMTGAAVSVSASPVAAVARDDDDGGGFFDTVGTLLSLPDDIGNLDIPGFGEGAGVMGAMGGIVDMFTGDSTEEQVGGGLSAGSGLLDLVGELGEETLGEAGDIVGGIGGMLGVGSDAMDAYHDFSEGNIGSGIFDVVKGGGDLISGLAEFGGFELTGTIAEMGAGEALAGAGAEGLAALGPVGAVIGAGIAGFEGGHLLYEGVDWVGDMVTGNEGADHSISGAGADAMVAADQALTSLWADPNEPEYTQTIGWQLAEILPSWMQ